MIILIVKRIACVCVCVCKFVYTYKFFYVYTHTHTNTHTHIYIYIYIYVQIDLVLYLGRSLSGSKTQLVYGMIPVNKSWNFMSRSNSKSVWQ